MLASTKDGFVRLIDKTNGQLLADYTGHLNREFRIDSCLLATDAHVVSGSEDAHLYIWSLIEVVYFVFQYICLSSTFSFGTLPFSHFAARAFDAGIRFGSLFEIVDSSLHTDFKDPLNA
ncbi:unnamed protein product [Gongylonema pulchrum]|uniref:WD_REPEATS_REGION domain-containing protein n=1 Tax=Gongylonema pulchrum TaxID=637853 RepID=A0A3P7Q0C3_9BILA|nr:unnamed protein product [Gongylonema pulchrum]